MNGDFSWLWRNEELSDFTLVIRPVINRQPEADQHESSTPSASEGNQAKTRSGKRKRSSKAASGQHGVTSNAASDEASPRDSNLQGLATPEGDPGSRRKSCRKTERNAEITQHIATDAAGGQVEQQQHAQQTDAAGQQAQLQLELGPRTRRRMQQLAEDQQLAAEQHRNGQHQQEQRQQGQQQQQPGQQDGRQVDQQEGQQQMQNEQQHEQQQQQQQRQQRQQQQQQEGAHCVQGKQERSRKTRRGPDRQQAGTAAVAAAVAQDGAQDNRRSRRHHQAGTGDHNDSLAAGAAAGDSDKQTTQQRCNEQQRDAAIVRQTRFSSRKKKPQRQQITAAAAAGASTSQAAAVERQHSESKSGRRRQHEQHKPPSTANAAAAAAEAAATEAVAALTIGGVAGVTTAAAAGAAAASGTINLTSERSSANSQEQQQQQQQQQEVQLPVHAVVLAGFSEYFKALICSWSGNLNRTLTLDVGLDEAHAAELMIQFMYTGKLPSDAPPEQLLKMVRLADQYQVTRFMAAASTSFESLPLSTLSLSVVLEVFNLPQVMLDAPEMALVAAKAKAKLLELYGDLEKVWSTEQLREQFLALPLPAVRCVLASESTSVATENTALVALAGWVEEGRAGRSTTVAQRKEVLSLIRLPFLTSAFIGDILHTVPWVADTLDTRQLLNAFQFAAASDSTRQRLASYECGPSALTPHFRCPRPVSTVNRASFEWTIELSTIKRMVADAKLWGRVVELSSPLHYFGGFWWQLLFNVERSPTPADAAPDVAAAAAAAAPVVEFVGVRCHVNCGAHDYWPRVVRFKATIAALQTGFWEMDYAYMKAIEGPIVDGVGLGYPGFFALPGQALESEAAWSRFVRQGRVQLRCEVLDCE